MQYLSNHTHIPATIVEYRHPVLVSSALKVQQTSVSLQCSSSTYKLFWQDPLRMAQSLLTRRCCPSEDLLKTCQYSTKSSQQKYL